MRKANFAEPKHYYGAFFEYTIGLERVIKLALIVDHCVENEDFPSSDRHLRRYGHSLTELMAALPGLRERLAPTARVWEAPDGAVADAALSALSDFARATRYYNIDVLTGKEPTSDPVERWFTEVGVPLLAARKGGPSVLWAKRVDDELGDSMQIRFTDAMGAPLNDLEGLARVSRDSEFVAKEGTFICAKWARCAISVLCSRAEQASQEFALPYFEEFFYPLLLEDSALKKRKTFML
ncbi:hypothetical protein AB0J38_12005 [Streptomyces sp. NPDC050095]|uniref:hypothetical protein n=1 Tax=unclassified Streptomyces TaxID=2593676 RepID=UPI0034131531